MALTITKEDLVALLIWNKLLIFTMGDGGYQKECASTNEKSASPLSGRISKLLVHGHMENLQFSQISSDLHIRLKVAIIATSYDPIAVAP